MPSLCSTTWASTRRTWWATTGARPRRGRLRRSAPTGSTTSWRCRSAIRRRSPMRGSRSGRSRGTCCCSSSSRSPRSGSPPIGGANFLSWSQHPDFEAVYAEVLANGSLTPALNYYRANVNPAALVGPSLELPPIQSPTMGMLGTADFAHTDEQMADSAVYCSADFATSVSTAPDTGSSGSGRRRQRVVARFPTRLMRCTRAGRACTTPISRRCRPRRREHRR